ncbi:MAG: glutamine--tRNA ligase/YqeY domain fusion protein [Acidobacteriota bacterium]
MSTADKPRGGNDFIREMIRADLASGKYEGVATRFPPEPNGYLHIGHAKSICLNFGLAEEFGGRCHLRFDDTNPNTEDPEYVESIQRDIRWLGWDWGEHLYFASDYFERMAAVAVTLIEKGRAYVDSCTPEEIRELRGTVTEPGRPGPYRDRSVEENLDLFRRMRAGEFEDGTHVLRGKIDLAATNMLMRDPVLYRIRHAHHYRQGDAWCIYPMYDFAHCLEDAFEGVTHSLCTLEFDNNRELYEWVLDHGGFERPRPEQTEFARLNVNYTVASKRKLLQLVQDGSVAGWDDPRMPTLSGLRRRGYTPESIREFCNRVGVTRTFNIIDVALLEHSIRDDLNHKAPRVMGVLDPLEVVIESYPEEQVEALDADYWPRDIPKDGSRKVPFARRIFIERDDFMEDPIAGFHRLAPGREVRLRYAYLVTCVGVDKDENGEVIRVRCTHDPASRGGEAPDGRRVKGTLHWVAADHAVAAEVRLYDRLFDTERPDAEDGDFRDHLNSSSLTVASQARLEPSLTGLEAGSHVQLERLGYFYADPDTTPERPVLNRTVTLRDTWAKVARQGESEVAKKAAERTAAREAYKAAQRAMAEGSEVPELEGEAKDVADAYVVRGLSEQDARLLALDPDLASFFDAALAVHDAPRSIANWLTNELSGRLGDRALGDLPFGPAELGELVALVDDGTLGGTAGKEVLGVMVDDGGRPADIVEARGLRQISDTGALEPVVAEILEQNAGQVAAYRGGKTALFGFFIGQVMRATGGKGDPQQVKALLKKALDG